MPFISNEEIVNRDREVFDKYYSIMVKDIEDHLSPEMQQLQLESAYITWVRSPELWKNQSDYMPEEYIDFYFKVDGVRDYVRKKIKRYCSIPKSLVQDENGLVFSISGIVCMTDEDLGVYLSSNSAQVKNRLMSCHICADTNIHSNPSNNINPVGKVNFLDATSLRSLVLDDEKGLSSSKPVPRLSYKLSDIGNQVEGIGLELKDCVTLQELFREVTTTHIRYLNNRHKKQPKTDVTQSGDIFEKIKISVQGEIKNYVRHLEQKNNRLAKLLNENGIDYDKVYPGAHFELKGASASSQVNHKYIKQSDFLLESNSDDSLLAVVGALLSLLMSERTRPYNQELAITCIQDKFGEKGFSKSKLNKLFSDANKAAKEKENENK